MFGKKQILAGWLIDGSGTPAEENVLITIENGVFKEIRKAATNVMISSAVVDLSGCTVVPGLMDAHVHLFMSGTVDRERRKRQLRDGFERIRKTISRHLEQLIAHGVLAVRDGGDQHGYTRHYKKYCMKEKYTAISIHAAGKAWHKPGRYGSFVGRVPKGRLAEGILRESDGIDHVKIIQSGLNSLKYFGKESLPQFQLRALREAVGAASSLGLKTMVHANGRLPVQIALEAGCSSIEHGFFMGEENLALMADSRVFWVPTACTMKAYGKYAGESGGEGQMALRNLEHQLEQIAMAKAFGVPIALGTDSGSMGVCHGNALVDELGLFLDAGFSIEEAIKCASLNAATLMGLDGRGLIKKGMQADFVVAKGHPAELPESLKSVFKIHAGDRFL